MTGKMSPEYEEKLSLKNLQGLDGYERTSLTLTSDEDVERIGSFDGERESLVSSLSGDLQRPSSPSESLRDSAVLSDSCSEEDLRDQSSVNPSDLLNTALSEAYIDIFDGTVSNGKKFVNFDDGASASAGGPIKVISENRGLLPSRFQHTRLAQTLTAHDGAIYALKFSADGRFLATGGEDGKVMVWIVGQLRSLEYTEESPSQSISENSRDSHNYSGSQSRGSTTTTTPTSGHVGNSSGMSNGSRNSSFNELQQQAQGDGDNAFPQTVASSDSGRDDCSSYPNPMQVGVGVEPDRSIVIYPVAFREYLGHTESVLDIAWSGSSFILSASADMFVRLWGIEEDKSKCLKLFGHEDIVTSVCFHPTNDTHFVSACFNGKLTLWDSIRGNVLDNFKSPLDPKNPSINVPITSVSFVPDGSRVFAGQRDGQIHIYGFRYAADKVKIARETSLDWLKDRKGKYSNGRKVTGICFDPSAKGGGDKMLRWCVTSNDSNVRLVESISPPFKYLGKFKGGRNTNLQIKANFSQDGRYVICPTEHGRVLIWETDPIAVDHAKCSMRAMNVGRKQSDTRRITGCEWFLCTGKGVDFRGKTMRIPATAAIFAPAASVHRLLDSAVEARRRSLYKKVRDSLTSSSNGGAPPPEPQPRNLPFMLPNDSELSSTIIVAADGDGNLRILLTSRLN